MKTSEVLKLAKELISNPEKWCQGAYAILPCGVSTSGDDPRACKFCSLGALQRVNPKITESFQGAMIASRPDSWFRATEFLRKAVRCEPDYDMYGEMPDFNDSHTHAEVMQVWDRAIALAEEEEAEQCATS